MMKGMPFLLVSITAFLLPCVASGSCSFCSDGSEVTKPDYVVEGYLEDPVTCKQLAIGLSFFVPDENHEDCKIAQRYGTLCGCPEREDGCRLCPDGSDIAADKRTLKIPEFWIAAGFFCLTCECIQAYIQSFGTSDAECGETQAISWQRCGCPTPSSGDFNISATSSTGQTLFPEDLATRDIDHYFWPGFFGTKNPEEMETLNRTVRVSAFLSILGSLAVVQDTVRSRDRRKHLYNQLASSMAAVDIIYATAVALQDIPRPTDDFFFAAGERGNDATCTAQGVVVQFSAMASLGFNCALATYFAFAIVYRATQSMLSRYRPWLLRLPIAGGFILAVCSFPMISTEIRGCYLVPPHSDLVLLLELTGLQASWVAYSVLFLVPGFCGIVYTTAAMAVVLRHVRKVHTTSSRWIFNGNSSTSQQRRARTPSIVSSGRRRTTNSMRRLEQQVTIQCGMYLVSLYSTWVVFFCLAPNPNDVIYTKYNLWVYVSVVMPLQGFLNSLIYFRPRLAAIYLKLIEGYTQRRQRTVEMIDTPAVHVALAAPVPNQSIEPSVELVAWHSLDNCEDEHQPVSRTDIPTNAEESKTEDCDACAATPAAPTISIEPVVELIARRSLMGSNVSAQDPPPPQDTEVAKSDFPTAGELDSSESVA